MRSVLSWWRSGGTRRGIQVVGLPFCSRPFLPPLYSRTPPIFSLTISADLASIDRSLARSHLAIGHCDERRWNAIAWILNRSEFGVHDVEWESHQASVSIMSAPRKTNATIDLLQQLFLLIYALLLLLIALTDGRPTFLVPNDRLHRVVRPPRWNRTLPFAHYFSISRFKQFNQS